jgi:hypothetical protein
MTVALHQIFTLMTLDHIAAAMTFDTIVAFVILLVALLTSSRDVA